MFWYKYGSNRQGGYIRAENKEEAKDYIRRIHVEHDRFNIDSLEEVEPVEEEKESKENLENSRSLTIDSKLKLGTGGARTDAPFFALMPRLGDEGEVVVKEARGNMAGFKGFYYLTYPISN